MRGVCKAVAPCLAYEAAISSSCYSCANNLCSQSKAAEIDARLSYWLGSMPPYMCNNKTSIYTVNADIVKVEDHAAVERAIDFSFIY